MRRMIAFNPKIQHQHEAQNILQAKKWP